MEEVQTEEEREAEISKQLANPDQIEAMVDYLEIPYERLSEVATVDIFVSICRKLKELEDVKE